MLLLMPIAHSFCLLPYSLQLVPRVTHSVPEKQESDGHGLMEQWAGQWSSG
jgi:hypothetical protein